MGISIPSVITSHAIPNECTGEIQKNINQSVRKGQLDTLHTLLEEHPQTNLASCDSQGISTWNHAVIAAITTRKLDALKELLTHQFGQLSTSILEFFGTALSQLQKIGVLHAYQVVNERFTLSDPLPIHLAAIRGDLKQVQEEVARDKKNVNRQTSEGISPLHCAVVSGNLEVVNYLLSKGAQKELVTSFKQTALHLAAAKNQVEVVKQLLQKGCLVDAQDAAGSTPLHYAMLHEDTIVSKLLLRNGADPYLSNQFELCPLQTFAALLRWKGYNNDVLRLEKADWLQTFSLLGSHILNATGVNPWIALLANTISQLFYVANPRNRDLARTESSPHESMWRRYGRGALNICSRLSLATNLTRIALWAVGSSTPAGIAQVAVYSALPLIAMRAHRSIKNALSGIKTAWAQLPYETYRPLRNMAVHVIGGSRVMDDVKFFRTLNSEISKAGNTETVDLDDLDQTRRENLIVEGKLDPNTPLHAQYILGLAPNEPNSCKTIKQAFRDLTQAWHPDTCQPQDRCRELFRALLKSKETMQQIHCQKPRGE